MQFLLRALASCRSASFRYVTTFSLVNILEIISSHISFSLVKSYLLAIGSNFEASSSVVTCPVYAAVITVLHPSLDHSYQQ